MASLNTLRTKFGAVLTVVIAFALLAFILSLKTDMGFSNNDPKVGEIDGDKIRYSEFLDEYESIKERMGVEATSDEQADRLVAATWQALFSKHVLEPGFERMGIAVPEAERLQIVSGQIPTQTFYSVFGNPSTGEYDAAAVARFLQQAQADPRAEQAWAELNEQAVTERNTMKYAALVSKGVYANKLEIAEGLESSAKLFSGRYASKKYSSIEDSEVEVSSSEIKSFYKANKEMFRQQPNRSLVYVLFEVNATDDDLLALEREVTATGAAFAEAENIKEFVRANRYGRISGNYLTAAQLGGEQAAALSEGKQYGPVLRNNEWTIARAVESRMAPDTVGLKAIMLPYTAEELADSLMSVANASNFAELATRYAANEELAAGGGYIGRYPFTAFEAEVAEALAGAREGDVVKVIAGNAIQIFNVCETGRPARHYKVATLTYPVEASAATLRNVHGKASLFTTHADGSVEKFRAAAEADTLATRVATLVEGARSLQGLENSREVVRWAADAKVGRLSEIFRVGKDYVVAMVTEIDDAEYVPVEKVAAQIRARLMRDKKFDRIVADLKASTLDAAAAEMGSEVGDFKDVSYGSFYVEGMGVEPGVVGAIVSTDATGKLSAPVKGLSGVYLFEVDAVTDSANALTEADAKVRVESMAEGMMQQRMLPALQELSEVKDRSARFF